MHRGGGDGAFHVEPWHRRDDRGDLRCAERRIIRGAEIDADPARRQRNFGLLEQADRVGSVQRDTVSHQLRTAIVEPQVADKGAGKVGTVDLEAVRALAVRRETHVVQ